MSVARTLAFVEIMPNVRIHRDRIDVTAKPAMWEHHHVSCARNLVPMFTVVITPIVSLTAMKLTASVKTAGHLTPAMFQLVAWISMNVIRFMVSLEVVVLTPPVPIHWVASLVRVLRAFREILRLSAWMSMNAAPVINAVKVPNALI